MSSSRKEDSVEKRKVVFYTVPDCRFCEGLRNYLTKKGIRFTEKDVSIDRTAAFEMMKRSRKNTVPQIWFNDSMVVGYDESRLNKILEQ